MKAGSMDSLNAEELLSSPSSGVLKFRGADLVRGESVDSFTLRSRASDVSLQPGPLCVCV